MDLEQYEEEVSCPLCGKPVSHERVKETVMEADQWQYWGCDCGSYVANEFDLSYLSERPENQRSHYSMQAREAPEGQVLCIWRDEKGDVDYALYDRKAFFP